MAFSFGAPEEADMVHKPLMQFGYNPPCGERGYETIVRRDFLKDVHRACDVASQSFDSLWTSDHLNYGSEFRVECWTLLTSCQGNRAGSATGSWRTGDRPQSVTTYSQ